MKYDFRTLGWSSMKLNGRRGGGGQLIDRQFCGAHSRLQHRLSLKLLTEGTMSAIPPQTANRRQVSLKLGAYFASNRLLLLVQPIRSAHLD